LPSESLLLELQQSLLLCLQEQETLAELSLLPQRSPVLRA
jgi:hypothetical protein